MKIAIIGSRSLRPDISKHLPAGCAEIITGGAKGVDTCAAEYAKKQGIKLTVFRPNYQRYGRGAPHRRNDQIIAAADQVLAFWDGTSKGTKSVIEKSRRAGKPCRVISENF
jgi:hypothetical protein